MLTESPADTRVLVVDDDAGLRVLLTQMLEHAGYAAIAAAGVDRALARLDEHSVDLVLTDLVMPGRGGLALLVDMHVEHPHVPALAMTGNDDRVLRDAALALGARAVLRKPVRFDELVRAVRAALTVETSGDLRFRGVAASGARVPA